MKKYIVGVTVVGGYSVGIEANSLEEAEEKAEELDVTVDDVEGWDVEFSIVEDDD